MRNFLHESNFCNRQIYEKIILKDYEFENKNIGCNILFYSVKLFHCFGLQD